MTFLAILLLAAMIATLAALVYGVVMFLKNSSATRCTAPARANMR